MRNLHRLIVRFYAEILININESLDIFPGAKASDNICDTKLNEILLHSIIISWINQVYVQGFYCESINFKNM